MQMDHLKYPIGKHEVLQTFDQASIDESIETLQKAPVLLKEAIQGLKKEQLLTPYREGGWTVWQVVNHLPDSHMNAYVRFKLALTEENPVIRPYAEHLWAELPDSHDTQPEVSIQLLSALHERWVILLKGLEEKDYYKTYYHPEDKEKVAVYQAIGMYSWHSRHHIAHITSLRERMGW
ncbi:YfiT family bacillithiol transferase [Bacillus gobiensis]|uniref:YfiT family bacillithiol transferase n=1 Tax=Bacillus gobiensis TaxID=1441095 RepID=UPI003D1A93B2